MGKIVWTGLEDSGKSYMMAVASVKITKRNAKWQEKTGIYRPIISNVAYSEEFHKLCRELDVIVEAWKDLEELPKLSERWPGGGDIFVDEIGTYFDARTFKDLPLDIRLWLAQASKLGWDMYGAAQDFAQVDVAFRRLTNQLFYVRKLAGSPRPAPSKPKVRLIWGLCTIREMDPIGYDEKMMQFNQKSVFPWPFLIRKDYCQIFKTNERVPKSKPPPFKHIARRCEVEGCGLEMFHTVKGVKHKIVHV